MESWLYLICLVSDLTGTWLFDLILLILVFWFFMCIKKVFVRSLPFFLMEKASTFVKNMKEQTELFFLQSKSISDVFWFRVSLQVIRHLDSICEKGGIITLYIGGGWCFPLEYLFGSQLAALVMCVLCFYCFFLLFTIQQLPPLLNQHHIESFEDTIKGKDVKIAKIHR